MSFLSNTLDQCLFILFHIHGDFTDEIWHLYLTFCLVSWYLSPVSHKTQAGTWSQPQSQPQYGAVNRVKPRGQRQTKDFRGGPFFSKNIGLAGPIIFKHFGPKTKFSVTEQEHPPAISKEVLHPSVHRSIIYYVTIYGEKAYLIQLSP